MYEEFIYGLLSNEQHWENKAAERLANFGIILSPQTILMNRKKIRSGERDPSCVANFSGKISDGEVYTSRYGKDGMYKQLKMMIDLFILNKDKSYVGLPANQILSAIKEYGSNVVACDKNEGMVQFMVMLQRHFGIPGKYATILNQDIFEYLESTDKKFSVFDFDLMCHITADNLIDKLASSVLKTAKDRCVVNIATTIGRKINEFTYRFMMPNDFINKIKGHMNVVHHYSDGYNDRIIPMRYEIFVLERKEKENIPEQLNLSFEKKIYKEECVVKFYDDRKEWYLNDKLHRVGGPAIEYYNGEKKYYIRGELND
jgi:hypothetical protein